MVPDDPRGSANQSTNADHPTSTGPTTTGSTNPFDFDDLPAQPDPRRGGSTSGATHSDGFDPFGLSAPGDSTHRQPAGQRLSWTALIMVLVGALAIGFGLGGALTSIRLDASAPFGAVLWWGTLALVGLLIILVALVTSIVGVVQADPRRVAVFALVGSVIIGWIAAYVGFRIGAQHLTAEAVRVVGVKGPQAVPAIEHYLDQRGIDAGAYTGLLRRVFG